MRRSARASALLSQAIVGVLAVVTAGVVVLGVPGGNARAAEGECARDIGTEVPVVLVHGFNSRMQTWAGEAASIDRALAREPGVHVQWFDYSDVATEWVTHRRIGPRLADFLACTAQVSLESGGPGRVVVVAHSMGGLATRCALDEKCAGRPGVAGVVDLVITLGTPHSGSLLRPAPLNLAGIGVNAGTQALLSACRSPLTLVDEARMFCTAIGAASGAFAATGLDRSLGPLIDSPAARAFTPGSQELAALPSFPDETAVVAMAGDVTLVTHLFHVLLVPLSTEEWSIGDAVVGVSSATAHHQDGVAAAGGRVVHGCGHLDLSTFGFVWPTCWHGAFTNDQTFTGDVLSAVRAYIADLAPAQAGDFTLGLGGAMGDLGYWATENAALALVTGALGPPDSDSGWIPPECGPVQGPTWRLVRWGAFELLFTESELPNPDGTVQPGGPVRHLAGWTYFQEDDGAVEPRLITEDGLTLGSTRAEVLAAFPTARETIGPFEGGALSVFLGDFGSLSVDLDAEGRVVALTSGQGGCGDV